jgi:hypothetical protein
VSISDLLSEGIDLGEITDAFESVGYKSYRCNR